MYINACVHERSGLAWELAARPLSLRIANNWPFTKNMPVGSWFELALVLTMTGGTSTASVQVDGKTVATGAPAAHQMTELTSILFGNQNADANVSWNVGFDDVHITMTR